ncbi:hypothetical protein [Mucisphaera calidilacus]|uniref:Uncharacterized protein n=1 Tax=Mucisphaera calidilacus TaxID=2527982 RepID=A0A518C0T9_9BACT|nr:hypothetical protein [Mucisphaera calidilacus]QDU72845.1 hypothetical protein Pan265_27210 [Mucisphaera calidilacus]
MSEQDGVSVFDPSADPIAVCLTELKLLKRHTPFGEFWDLRHNELCVASLALDERGAREGKLGVNRTVFPHMRPGMTAGFGGDGYLAYGPENPGGFLVVQMMVFECDRDIRRFGADFEKVASSKAAELGLGMLAANPGYAAAAALVRELAREATAMMKRNRDDHLGSMELSLLRGTDVPYQVNRSYTSANEYVSMTMGVKPLRSSNGQGRMPVVVEGA